MVRPGKRNLITDVEGIAVGQAEDVAGRTGVTVLFMDKEYPAAVDVRGGAPGTVETDALNPVALGGEVDAITLAGGSIYGVEAAAAAVTWLGVRGRGFRFTPQSPSVPIVPGAIIFDLANGGKKDWGLVPPYRALTLAALEKTGGDFRLGNTGAGLGATAGAYKGGTGSASIETDDGFVVGAIAIVNSVGSPLIPGTDVFWAFPYEQNAEFGGRRLKADFKSIDLDLPADMKGRARPDTNMGTNTTIAVVATNADLTRVELERVAIMACDGFARSLRPVHAPSDGDTIFTVGTGKRAIAEPRWPDVMRLGHLAADCLARAVARGVYEADTLGPYKSYREMFG